MNNHDPRISDYQDYMFSILYAYEAKNKKVETSDQNTDNPEKNVSYEEAVDKFGHDLEIFTYEQKMYPQDY